MTQPRKDILTQEHLKELLNYSPDSGIFTWLVSQGRVKVGDFAGSKNCGYICISINRQTYGAHRLAALYMMGKFPCGEMDHINRIKDDNRWCNLRECTLSQNRANTQEQKNNTSGFKGVCWSKSTQSWCAKIKHNKKQYHIGSFDQARDAAIAYNKRAIEVFGEFAYLNKINTN